MAVNTPMTIFYSWESDLPSSENRDFILMALKGAAARIREDGSLEVEPVVQRDTAGEPGSPDVARSILERIDRADVFVADVSLVTPLDSPRPIPNPNVVFELGYAVARLGWGRILLVLNTAFGSPENLPFDLRGHRVVDYRFEPESSHGPTELELHLADGLKDIMKHLQPKPPQAQQLLSLIRSSNRNDWRYNDSAGVFVYQQNVVLRIHDRRDPRDHPFREAWTERHADRLAYREWYDIYYGSSLIHSFMLVSVDGGRAEVPPPELGTDVITMNDYLLAKVVDTSGSLDEYIRRSGLRVSNS